MHGCIQQFLYFRPLIQIVGAIGAYTGNENLYSIAGILAAISTVIMIPGLLTFTRVLYDKCDGLYVATKFIVIKISVGLILIEDIVQQYLYTSGIVSISDDFGSEVYSEEEKFVRIYCLIALVECAILSWFLFYGFTPPLEAAENCILMAESDLPLGSVDASSHQLTLTWHWLLGNTIAFRKWTCSRYLNISSSQAISNSTLKENLLDTEASVSG